MFQTKIKKLSVLEQFNRLHKLKTGDKVVLKPFQHNDYPKDDLEILKKYPGYVKYPDYECWDFSFRIGSTAIVCYINDVIKVEEYMNNKLPEFLEFLEEDIKKNPHNVTPLCKSTLERITKLVEGINVDLNEPIKSEPHTCPYDEVIYDDFETMCTCSPAATQCCKNRL